MMMPIDEELLAGYVDGELSPAEIAEVEKLLARNEEARRKVKELRDITALLRSSCAEQRFTPAPEKFLTLAASGHPGSDERRPWRSLAATTGRRLALAASLLLLIAGGITTTIHLDRLLPQDDHDSAELLEELAEYHFIYARETEHLVEVPANRKTHIEEWLGSRLKRKLIVPDLARNGLEFVGARMLVMEGNPVAQLIYKGEGISPVALCITPFDTKVGSFAVDKLHDLNVGYWSEAGYIYVVIGDIPKGDVWRIAAEVESQLANL
jgi:anti-sigma factor RsiW